MLPLLDKLPGRTGSREQAASFASGFVEYRRKNFRRAVALWMRAAREGDVEAQYWLGACFAKGEGVLRSIGDAVVWYRRAAEGGHLEAQYRLGLIFLEGVASDQAVSTWLRTAADRDIFVA